MRVDATIHHVMNIQAPGRFLDVWAGEMMVLFMQNTCDLMHRLMAFNSLSFREGHGMAFGTELIHSCEMARQLSPMDFRTYE